jgi:hypothetical protein
MASFSGQDRSCGGFRVFGKYLKICNFYTPEDHILKVSAYSIHVFIARRMPLQIIHLKLITLTAFGEQHKL